MEVGKIYIIHEGTKRECIFLIIKYLHRPNFFDNYECKVLQGEWGNNLTDEGKPRFTLSGNTEEPKEIGESKITELLYE